MSGFLGDTMQSILGGGVPGSQPKGGLIGGSEGLSMRGGSVRGRDRTVLRKAFGNSRLALTNLPNGYSSLGYATNIGSKTGSFRAAMNAGDVLGFKNEAANKQYGIISNQVNGITRTTAVGGWKSLADGVRTNGRAAYVGNSSYVYDSSDFIRYKKLAAKNKNYNDSSFGGGIAQTQATALAKVRH